jgi:hypothetical protein
MIRNAVDNDRFVSLVFDDARHIFEHIIPPRLLQQILSALHGKNNLNINLGIRACHVSSWLWLYHVIPSGFIWDDLVVRILPSLRDFSPCKPVNDHSPIPRLSHLESYRPIDFLMQDNETILQRFMGYSKLFADKLLAIVAPIPKG